MSENRDVTILLRNPNDDYKIRIYEIFNEGVKVGDEFYKKGWCKLVK